MFLGKTFKFDVDIDGGRDSGGDLAGIYVEVHLKDGTVHSGITLPDGTNPNRSVIGW